MKKRNTFNINKWVEAKKQEHDQFVENSKFIARHPLTWFFLIAIIVYSFGL